MSTLADLNSAINDLKAGQATLIALCDSLKTQFDALKASHGATTDELTAVVAEITPLTSAAAATVTRDTPAP